MRVLWVLFLGWLPIVAMAQFVQVQLFRPPPNQLRESDLWRVRLVNPSNETLQVYLEGTVDEAKDGRIAHARSTVFDLPPGVHTLTGTQLSPIEVIQLSQRYRAIFERTGQVPSGEYTVCVTAYAAESGEELGSDCFDQIVEHTTPPLLLEPEDGDTVREERPTFVWLPPTPLRPGQMVTYTLRIVEVFGRQTPYDAMLRNAAFFVQSSIRTSMLLYPFRARSFESGKRYAWQVSAYGSGAVLLGKSEVWSFAFVPEVSEAGSESKAGIDISVLAAGLAHSFIVKTQKRNITQHPIAFRTEYLLPQLATKQISAKVDILKAIAQAAVQRKMPQRQASVQQAVLPPLRQIWQRYINGVAYGWGDNRDRQIGGQAVSIVTPKLVGLSGIVALACGYWHSLAIDQKGELVAWGKNDYGQCGQPAGGRVSTPKTVLHPQQKKFIAVAAGERHSLALDEDRRLWAWGINRDGELGNGTLSIMEEAPVAVSEFLKLGPIDGIAAGVAHSLALAGGQVYAWGSNLYAQVGFVPQDYAECRIPKPRRVEGLRNIVAIAAGDYHSLALDQQGYVWAWGRNANGQVHPDSGQIVAHPIRVPGLTDVIDIAAGSCFSVALRRDSTVWIWGSNELGLTGDGSRVNPSKPRKVQGVRQIVRIVAGGSHILALRADGSILAWGNNALGQLGTGSVADPIEQVLQPPLPVSPVEIP